MEIPCNQNYFHGSKNYLHGSNFTCHGSRNTSMEVGGSFRGLIYVHGSRWKFPWNLIETSVDAD